MTKGKLFLVVLTTFILALVPDFLADFVSPWLDPGNDTAMRTYLVIACGVLWLLAFLWTTRQQKREGNPQRPRMLGWFETVSGVTLVFTASVMLCWEVGAGLNDRPPGVLWLVPAGIALGSLAVEWPTDRKRRYEDLSKWIWSQLLTEGSVNIQKTIRHFVPTPEFVIHTPAASIEHERKVSEYKVLILWFHKQNEKLGVKIHNGQLVWHPPPTVDGRLEYRPPYMR